MLLKPLIMAFIIWLIIFIGFVIVHEEAHAKICTYYNGNPAIDYFKPENWDIKSFMICDNLSWDYVDFNQYELAQSNVESASTIFIPLSFFFMAMTFFGLTYIERIENEVDEK